MLHIITSSGDKVLGLLTTMTSSDLKLLKYGVLINFAKFPAATHIIRVNCARMAEDRPR